MSGFSISSTGSTGSNTISEITREDRITKLLKERGLSDQDCKEFFSLNGTREEYLNFLESKGISTSSFKSKDKSSPIGTGKGNFVISNKTTAGETTGDGKTIDKKSALREIFKANTKGGAAVFGSTGVSKLYFVLNDKDKDYALGLLDKYKDIFNIEYCDSIDELQSKIKGSNS